LNQEEPVNQPAEQQRQIKHFIVTADVFDNVIQALGRASYNTAAPILSVLTQGSKAIFEGDGQIAETPDSVLLEKCYDRLVAMKKCPLCTNKGHHHQACPVGNLMEQRALAAEDPPADPPPAGNGAGDGKIDDTGKGE
jgi:hypothetical protein